MAQRNELQPSVYSMKLEKRIENSQTGTENTEKITLYEEDLYKAPKLKEETIQLVVFRLGSEWYGIQITKVKEVITIESLTYLPSSPEYVAGIINLRGNILSVIDLKKIFGLPQGKPAEKSRPVVVVSDISETGFLVDEVAEAIDIPVNKIDPPLTTLSPDVADYVEGECKIGDKLIGILNTEKIFEIKK